MAQNSITVSTDSDTLLAADTLFASFGIDTQTAVNLFLHQAVLEQALPFSVHIPSRTAETISSASGEPFVHTHQDLPSGTIIAHPEPFHNDDVNSFSCPGAIDFGTFGDDDEEIGCQG